MRCPRIEYRGQRIPLYMTNVVINDSIAAVPEPSIGLGVLLAAGDLLVGAKLWERRKKLPWFGIRGQGAT